MTWGRGSKFKLLRKIIAFFILNVFSSVGLMCLIERWFEWSTASSAWRSQSIKLRGAYLLELVMSALNTTVIILICQMLDTDKASGPREMFIQKSFQKSIANTREQMPLEPEKRSVSECWVSECPPSCNLNILHNYIPQSISCAKHTTSKQRVKSLTSYWTPILRFANNFEMENIQRDIYCKLFNSI